ncbi:TPA: class II fructose-bisphosphate aldolase [Klebsiella pneumoniae]
MKTLSDYLARCYQQHRAIPAYNFNDCWDLRAMCDAVAGELAQPLLAMSYGQVVEAHGAAGCAAMVAAVRSRYSQPVFLHLDHCDNIERCIAAVDAGYDAVMFDGSALSLEENIRGTREVTDYAHRKGVLVEAEIGRIRGRGFQDGDDYLAQVDDVVALAQQSGADLIAVGVGTAHGFYQGAPEINFARLDAIYQATTTPLVLHGGTGIPVADLRRAIQSGVVKINVGTALHTAYMTALREALAEDGDSAYPPLTIGKAMARVKQEALHYARAIGGETL